MTASESWNGGYGTRNGGNTRTTSPTAIATRVSRQSFMGRDAVTSQYNRAPLVPARDSTCAGLFLLLSRSLCYGYTLFPLNAQILPFNPATCHTTNKFNILMTIRSPARQPFLYFDKAHYRVLREPSHSGGVRTTCTSRLNTLRKLLSTPPVRPGSYSINSIRSARTPVSSRSGATNRF